MADQPRAGEVVTDMPQQRSGFVRRGHCKVCGWHSHDRITRYSFPKFWKVSAMYDVCNNCSASTKVWP